MAEKIYIFDTTLRDGEQSPGASMGISDKVDMALQLERLGVDIIEAGFPIASEGEFKAVMEIGKIIKNSTVAGLTRTKLEDIERTWEALKYAKFPRLHVFVATSDIHLKYKLRKTRDEVIKEAVEAVRFASSLTEDVEFSAEDATRTDRDYLCEVIEAIIDAGAKVFNIPDTVGYTVPAEFEALLKYIHKRVSNIDKVILSTHCHNDLGLAVANSITAIQNGVRQVECTVNGIGERAGNAALEEIVMTIKTRKDLFPFYTDVKTEEIYKTSRLLSHKTGLLVPRNKPIVGDNAFSHEAGIHQHGVIQKALTYEIMTPESVGRPKSTLAFGKHSGRHGLKKRYEELGYTLADKEIDKIYERFIKLADKKREIFDNDLLALLDDEKRVVRESYKLESINIMTGEYPIAVVKLKDKAPETAIGNGPVDAAYKAIEKATSISGKLLEYSIKAATIGKDAIGEAFVSVDFNGSIVVGTASSTDVIEASTKAYLDAINKYVSIHKQ